MNEATQSATQSVLEHHLQALRKGVDAVMEDYSDDSVVITPDSTFYGLSEIEVFFTAFFQALPDGIWDSFVMRRQEVAGDVAFILWEANPWFPMATDTFVIREGKIACQTFAALAAEGGNA